jgi:hypothetical protein
LEQQEAISTERQRLGRMTFEEIGIPLGATLTFSKDPQVTCTISTAKKVNFEGQEMSLSKAALIQIQRMGYQWQTVAESGRNAVAVHSKRVAESQ